MKTELIHRFPSIIMEEYCSKEGAKVSAGQPPSPFSLSYGGSQSWAKKKSVQKKGCGVISATDLLLYLHLYHPGCETEIFRESGKKQQAEQMKKQKPQEMSGTGKNPKPQETPEMSGMRKIQKSQEYPQGVFSREQYLGFAEKIRRRFLPMISFTGITGWGLALGLNRYFYSYHVPFRAVWCFGGKKIWKHMKQMLASDLPVILAIGSNMPLPWGKHKLRFYRENGRGAYQPVCQVKAHFVTVTGMDETWICISSWGKKYFINRKEYEEYVKKHSSFLVSNLICLKSRRKG